MKAKENNFTITITDQNTQNLSRHPLTYPHHLLILLHLTKLATKLITEQLAFI